MSLIDTVTVELSAVLGATDIPIRQLLRMGRGATISLDLGWDDPTLIYANDQLVALGEVQVDGENILLAVTQVLGRGLR